MSYIFVLYIVHIQACIINAQRYVHTFIDKVCKAQTKESYNVHVYRGANGIKKKQVYLPTNINNNKQ